VRGVVSAAGYGTGTAGGAVPGLVDAISGAACGWSLETGH